MVIVRDTGSSDVQDESPTVAHDGYDEESDEADIRSKSEGLD